MKKVPTNLLPNDVWEWCMVQSIKAHHKNNSWSLCSKHKYHGSQSKGGAPSRSNHIHPILLFHDDRNNLSWCSSIVQHITKKHHQKDAKAKGHTGLSFGGMMVLEGLPHFFEVTFFNYSLHPYKLSGPPDRLRGWFHQLGSCGRFILKLFHLFPAVFGELQRWSPRGLQGVEYA